MGKISSVLLCVGAFLSCQSHALASAEIAVDGTCFVDTAGRTVLLRGVNTAGNSKVAPFLPFADLAKLDPLADWGLNVLRLIFVWEAYEPEPGRYDEEYLARITRVVDAAWERGIYTILDLHQDGYSRYLGGGCGAGFPAWAVPEKLRKIRPPRECGQLWAVGIALGPSMYRAFTEFFSGENGTRAAYLTLWRRLALRFKGHPGLIGYDPINEPWANEKTELAPLYDEVAASIHGEDPSALIFVEPDVRTVPGLTSTRLAKPGFPNAVYAPHFYDIGATVGKFWSPKLAGLSARLFRRMHAKAEEWGVPLLVGEFGAYGTTRNADKFMDFQYGMLDSELASATQWNYTPDWSPEHNDGWNREDYSIVDHTGSLRPNFKVRPYARATAGKLRRLSVDRNANGGVDSVVVEWENDPRAGGTEIFAPRRSVFGGFPVRIEATGDGLSCAYDATETRVLCSAPASGPMRARISPD